MLGRLLSTRPFTNVGPVARLAVDMHDVYPPSHWAIRGESPAYDTPDSDVYLVGRNAVLLAKAGVYCAHHGLRRLVLGTLAGNPFPDASPAFFTAMAQALSLGLAHPIAIEAPLAGSRKSDVIRPRPESRRPPGPDDVVHATTGEPALRPVQQVSRAAGRLQRNRRDRPGDLRGGVAALTAVPTRGARRVSGPRAASPALGIRRPDPVAAPHGLARPDASSRRPAPRDAASALCAAGGRAPSRSRTRKTAGRRWSSRNRPRPCPEA